MTTWTSDELSKIGDSDELELSSLQHDGTPRTPVTVWVVRVGNNLYVRSANGPTGSWFRAAQVRHEGYIQAGGTSKDVAFVVETDHAIHDRIDAAYRSKYRRYGARYVDSIVGPESRAATIKLVPRQTNPKTKDSTKS